MQPHVQSMERWHFGVMTWPIAGNLWTVIENSRHFFNTKVKGKSGIWLYSQFPLKLQLCFRSTARRGFGLPWHQKLILEESVSFFWQGLILNVLIDGGHPVIRRRLNNDLLGDTHWRRDAFAAVSKELLSHFSCCTTPGPLNALCPYSPAPPLEQLCECLQAWTWTSEHWGIQTSSLCNLCVQPIKESFAISD